MTTREPVKTRRLSSGAGLGKTPLVRSPRAARRYFPEPRVKRCWLPPGLLATVVKLRDMVGEFENQVFAPETKLYNLK
jgi:hypothetical protein